MFDTVKKMLGIKERPAVMLVVDPLASNEPLHFPVELGKQVDQILKASSFDEQCKAAAEPGDL